MITGQVPVREYGVVACHVPNGSACDLHGCPPFIPNLGLAHQRLTEGFAFVGLADAWALSACLFAASFGVRCVPALMSNSRPTPPHPNRTPAAAYLASEALANIYADPADMQLYRWAKVSLTVSGAACKITC